LENERGGVGPGPSSAGPGKPGETGQDPLDTATEAADWLVELHTSEEVAPLVSRFREWLNASPGNRREYSSLERIWRIVIRRYGPGLREDTEWPTPIVAPPPGRSTAFRVRARSVLTLCVSLLAIAVVIIRLRFTPQMVLQDSHCRTPVEQRQRGCMLSHGSFSTDSAGNRTLGLVDGSEIVLHANSQVRLDLSPAHRHIWLDRGAALFRVHKDSMSVFDVRVGNVIVRAVGTRFSVQDRGPDWAETVVEEGKVEVAIKDRSSMVLSAGQIADVTPRGISVRSPDDKRSPSEPGLIYLDGRTIGQAADEFNRYNRQKIQVDPEIAQQRVGGHFPLNNPEVFAKALQELWGIERSVSRDPLSGVETIYLKGRSPHGAARYSPGKRNGLAEQP